MGIGLQLYTLRDETSQDFVGTLRKVAELGYEGVEFAGYGGLEASELKALLDELNLQAIGSHVGVDRLRDHLEEEAEFNKAIGSKYIICPYMPEELRGDAWAEQFKLFAEVAEKLKAYDLEFAYHNHDFEITEHINGERVFDALFIQAPGVKAEMDVCWVQVAGLNPLEYIKQYSGRLPLIHLKDMRLTENGVQTVVLGEGEVDLPNVIKTAGEAGVQWLVVEQDTCQLPPLTSVGISMEWLRKNYIGQ